MASWFDEQPMSGAPTSIQGGVQAPQGGTAPPVTDTSGSGFTTGTYTGGGQYPLASVMGTGLMAPWTTPFTAPTAAQAAQTPGYQFAAQQGNQAIERSAAAKGTLLNGGTLKDLAAYNQGLASTTYGDTYNRALAEYQQAMATFNNNATTQYNRLMGVSTSGQNAAAGQATAATNYGQNASNTITDIGNAQAAGQVGSASAWNAGLTNTGQTLADLYALNKSGYGDTSGWTNNQAIWGK